MRSTSWLVSAAAAVVLCGSALADELKVPAGAGGANTPSSGMSMDSVEAKYGAPTKRVPAVGGASAQQPPITRWEYPGFVVFFENNHVIHTVITPG
jgi:hypothetical protein